ncbi:unnamed protein product [Prorocentrum cordatum]|uniref:C3H1-type domain-containing protein n=1 Tax=Prorocentrum cordatum TaxID=2364126 RepID=A0ABN9SWF2_9DINO|nr:unnamed protein product [Polarella glacialis]
MPSVFDYFEAAARGDGEGAVPLPPLAHQPSGPIGPHLSWSACSAATGRPAGPDGQVRDLLSILQAGEACGIQLLDAPAPLAPRAEAGAVAGGRASWRGWLREGFGSGGKRALLATWGPGAWKAAATLVSRGGIRADHRSLLRAGGFKFSKLWGPGEGPDASPAAVIEALLQLAPDETRGLSRAHRKASAASAAQAEAVAAPNLAPAALFGGMKKSAAQQLELQFGDAAGASALSVVNVGVDHAASRALRACGAGKGKHCKFKGRQALARRCWDIILREKFRSSKISDKDKSTMRAVASNAIWTSAAAKNTVYDVSPNCELCGQHDDSLWHSLWQCSACAEERARLVPEDILDLAMDRKTDNYEYTLFVHGALRRLFMSRATLEAKRNAARAVAARVAAEAAERQGAAAEAQEPPEAEEEGAPRAPGPAPAGPSSAWPSGPAFSAGGRKARPGKKRPRKSSRQMPDVLLRSKLMPCAAHLRGSCMFGARCAMAHSLKEVHTAREPLLKIVRKAAAAAPSASEGSEGYSDSSSLPEKADRGAGARAPADRGGAA